MASGEYPVVSYWKQTLIQSDNRLAALATDRSHYLFELPVGTEGVQVSAQLIFRRVFQDVADEKGWDNPDIVLAEEITAAWLQVFLPLINATLL